MQLQERNIILDPTIFRAYDIRGIVGQNLSEEVVFLIGKAIGSILCELNETTLVIARDGRLSSEPLLKALQYGVCSVGIHVLNLGLVPTPLLYYATQVLTIQSGVMITGSHNPANYNGLKIVICGKTLVNDQINALYIRIMQKHFAPSGKGKHSVCMLSEQYVQEISQQITLLRPLRVVIDAGNGAAGHIAPLVYRLLGCHVHTLYCDIDGAFPHHHPDPSQVSNLQDLIQMVREVQADVGLAFDGDGDRLGVVTSQGEMIYPDRLLMLFAKKLLLQQPGAKIIYDVKCTTDLEKWIRALQGQAIMWKTGHSFIKEKLVETQAQLAGEMSGHFFFKDRWYGFDDAIYAGARLLEILSQYSYVSHEVFALIPNSISTPELKIAVREECKFILIERLMAQAKFIEANIIVIDGIRVNFKQGWGLVRASNTTPYLILRFEAMSQCVLHHIQTLFREWILSVEPTLQLPF